MSFWVNCISHGPNCRRGHKRGRGRSQHAGCRRIQGAVGARATGSHIPGVLAQEAPCLPMNPASRSLSRPCRTSLAADVHSNADKRQSKSASKFACHSSESLLFGYSSALDTYPKILHSCLLGPPEVEQGGQGGDHEHVYHVHHGLVLDENVDDEDQEHCHGLDRPQGQVVAGHHDVPVAPGQT